MVPGGNTKMHTIFDYIREKLILEQEAGEDILLTENLSEGMVGCAAAKYGYKQNKAIIDNAHAALKHCNKDPNPEKCRLLNKGRIRVSLKPFKRSVAAVRKRCKNAKEILG
jgi:hypothetical protein